MVKLQTVIYIAIVLVFLLLLWVFIRSRTRITDHYEKFWDPKIDELRQKLSKVFHKELENTEIAGSNKSFTINKQYIHLCLKNKSGEYYSDNMLIYVLLHELAHVLCDEIGHTDKFKDIFTDLLLRAAQHGLYDPTIPPEDNYCE